MRLGFLHTVPALATSFDALLLERRPEATAVHVVDADLLAEAVRSGVGDGIRATVAAHVAHLAARGADAVLVTCSSIGEAAEAAADGATVPVLRVDTAMAALARRAAAEGQGRIAVLATLEATLGPTGRLLARADAHASDASSGSLSSGAPASGAPASGAPAPTLDVSAAVVAGALDARLAGDTARHDALIAAAVADAAAAADVIVLAQASMAGAAAQADVTIPVLSSPVSAIEAAIGAAAAATAAARAAAHPASGRDGEAES